MKSFIDEDPRLAIVIEIPSGKVNHNRHGGAGSGLSVYGFAVGMLYQAIVTAHPLGAEFVAGVLESKWIGGHTKDKRRRVARTYQPGYDQAKDRGGDEADAICLAVWYARQQGEEQ